MASEMTAHAVLEKGMRFDVEASSGHHITLDSSVEGGGTDSGARPMELLLMALASCTGMDIISILRKKRQDVKAYEVRVQGARTDQYPRIFTQITVEHILTGHALSTTAVEHAIALSEERYCGVGAMLRASAQLTHTYRLIEG
jgi:putative redox protein